METESRQEVEEDSDTLIIDYNSQLQLENINIDYRNSNYKKIIIQFEPLKKSFYLKQDFKIGKGGILWDGVRKYIYL
jgi:uncharacterized protein YjbK